VSGGIVWSVQTHWKQLLLHENVRKALGTTLATVVGGVTIVFRESTLWMTGIA